MNIFNRSITVSITTEDNKVATVNGIFLDSYQEMYLTLTVDLAVFKILTARRGFRRTPHEDCPGCESLIPNLAGLRFGPDIGKKITAAVGLEYGCAHLADLAKECYKSLFQAKLTIMRLTQTDEETKSATGKTSSGKLLSLPATKVKKSEEM